MSTRRKPARKPARQSARPAGAQDRATAVVTPMVETGYSAEAIREITQGKRFLAADRAQLEVQEIATWDRYLLREQRLLVPVDVQALYVPEGSSEKMLRLPLLLAGANGKVATKVEQGMPQPFAEGTPRPAGVHLHWAMPDALLRGRLQQRNDGSANRLALPLLPDRWVLLRTVLPKDRSEPVVTGWVLEADRAIAVPLGSWTEGAGVPQGIKPAGETLQKDELTGTVGGAISWAGVYDAVLNRFAFHDPLNDLKTIAPNGVDEECCAYLVAGWWSQPEHDPLDAARSNKSLHELLHSLRWELLREWGDAKWAQEKDKAEWDLRKALGLEKGERWSSPRPARPLSTRAAPAQAHVPVNTTFMERQALNASSAFATQAARRYVAEPWHLRSSLLHGAIYGVPVAGAPPVDLRPSPNALSVAFGQHDDDLVAAFASPAGATPAQRRATERLLSAFTSQKVNRLAAADGLAELEEHEHSAGFSSLGAGIAGTDRYLQRVQTGGVGGLQVGRKRPKIDLNLPSSGKSAGKAAERAAPGAELVFSLSSKPNLVQATELMVQDAARSRVGDVLAATEARVVDRPAARHTFANEPLVALRGVARSLRHGGDGRASANETLQCRWPMHVINEITGIVAKDRFIKTLGNGSIPSEVLSLAREALLHDPYHDDWTARAVAPAGAGRTAVLNRLKAESLLRFSPEGRYDGSTAFLRGDAPKGTRAAPNPIEPGMRQQQTRMADEALRFSLYKGADPSPIGVTAWAQPWVPMWLEWEVQVEGLDPPSLAAWKLGSVELQGASTSFEGGQALLRGRAQLTTGAAHTLKSAIHDWLKAEDALDDVGAGLVDDKTEKALRTLEQAVEHLDVVTAALDGLRTQLLGLPVSDGLRRPAAGAGVAQPAPVAAPRMVLAGCALLKRLRLLDIFGRTLEVPLAKVATPTRASVANRPGALALPPRLLRPARWQFRLVDAATQVGAEGVEARVDQIDATLQVNPVAGFVMPDHLDESLEVFAIDGSPVGELLHEAASGGVMWEIAAGRSGPADAGPLYGLAGGQLALGRFAAGLVAADANARAGAVLDPESAKESALSALLRAIDTTLWTVDSFASLGSEHVAGLVGRPVAVVRAQLRLELKPTDDIDLSNPQRAQEWAQAQSAAARHAFPVRIGELTRSDDGVLGFFVDDDYSSFRLVDKAIAANAVRSGRSRGQLGLYAADSGMPAQSSIHHPYIAGTDDADTLMLHLGQTVTLTLFMHPAGKATLSSGVLPRKALALARDWVGPGLAKLAPSLRTGPVLVETDMDKQGQVRLPKVSVFGKNQNFLWRDTPATWRTDAILAATQTALLPDTPAELREGWIRVAPDAPGEGA